VLRAVPTAPVAPAHRSKAPGGRDWVSPRGPKASLGSWLEKGLEKGLSLCRLSATAVARQGRIYRKTLYGDFCRYES
jgi:hypothetical protein